MSKSIDFHEGYIQALIDMKKSLPPEFSVGVAIQEHADAIGKILDEMREAYNKERK